MRCHIKHIKVFRSLIGITIFIAVFFSSMLGAQLFGVSLNKIALIPLLVYLVFFFIFSNKEMAVQRSIVPLSLFFILGSVSAIYSLTSPYTYLDEYTSRSVLFFVQTIVIYLPLLFFLSNYAVEQDKKNLIVKLLQRSIVITYRIHIIVALAEFVMFFVMDVDFAVMILSPFYGSEVSPALINLGSLGIFLRPTGLNTDPAYFGIMLVFGFLLDKNKFWKLLAFISACIAMSRVAILSVAIIFIFSINFRKLKLRTIFLFAALIAVTLIVVFTNEYLNAQVMGLLSRFTTDSGQDIGTMRHLLYIPKSMYLWFFEYNPLQKLIGFGPRQSGTIIAQSGVMSEYLIETMFTESWPTECDFSELLLGYGLIGLALYIISVLRLRKSKERGLAVCLVILLFGIMYDISSSTFVLLVIITYTCSLKQECFEPAKVKRIRKIRRTIKWSV